MSHSCSSVPSCSCFYFTFALWFGLCFSFCWKSIRLRQCLWGLAPPVCHGVWDNYGGTHPRGWQDLSSSCGNGLLQCVLKCMPLLWENYSRQHGVGAKRPVKNGGSFFQGGKKPRKTNPTVALSDMSRECPYPAPGLDSVLLITAFLTAERKSLNLFTLGFPQQHFGTAPTPYLHAWKLLPSARDWAAVCTKPWICDHPSWLKVWEKHLCVSLHCCELACCRRPCKGALEPKECCCKGPKHRTAVLSGSVLLRIHSSALPWVQSFPPSRTGCLSGK